MFTASGGDDADLAKIEDIYFGYGTGHEGLDLVWFADVRRALRAYVAAARAAESAVDGTPRARASRSQVTSTT